MTNHCFFIYVDMLFEDDTSLLSFFERHKEDEDDSDLKAAVMKYVGAGAIGGKTQNLED